MTRNAPATPLALRAARLGFGLMVLAALGRQLTIHVGLGLSPVNFVSYFTNLSNLLAGCVLIAGAADGSLRPGGRLRAAAVTYMVVVGVVFTLLLRNADLGSLRPWINVVLHYVMPCVMVLDWLLQPPSRRLAAADLLLMLIYPACYLGYVVVRGAAVDWYPYFFFDPARIGGYGRVALYAAGFTLTILLTGWAVIAGGRRPVPR